MRLPDSFLDEIRDRVPISALIGTRLSWDRRKTNASRGDYWACCPFHGEKSPSFHCEDKKGRYHCFGCGVSGDHFRFLTELDSLSFPEAVERVADMAGVPMPARDPVAEKREKERASLHDVMEMATAFFEEQLQSSGGAKARAYLRDRGLTSVTQREFRLGYAPDSRNALKEHLASKGVDKSQIEACGLVVFGDDIPVSYDRFRDRIMFPIEDTRGRIIAFGGRAMSAEVSAKYLNSPDTELFHKGNVVYNFARARKGQGKDGTLILVEGYMDVIALAQAGFTNAVAPLGTALTENQIELIWRATGEPVLCFDGDGAGQRAAWRAADLILPTVAAGRTARFVLLPEGKDPDDLVREEGPDAFRRSLSEARPLGDLIWSRETGGQVFETPERRAALEQVLREITGRIRDESVRRHYQQDMRDRVHAFFGSTRPNNRYNNNDRGKGRGDNNWRGGDGRQGGGGRGPMAVSESLTRSALVNNSGALPIRESAMLVSLVNHPGLIDAFFDDIERLELDHPVLRQLHAGILDAAAHQATGDRQALTDYLNNSGLNEPLEKASLIVRRVGNWTALEDADIADTRDAFLQLLYLHRSASTLHRELKAAQLALANDTTEENFRHLLDIQAQFREFQAVDALIEGFGISSGRARQS
ncbi:DNA primase [Tianweitania populi]|uniref:DNA primase n=1 Tax=Tianweitania populi TaxID=1607949 RepID=A0A8J3DP29_9HYPH|nr:DNA primase [Tianweitania populi]GHD11307.1 DNA primase [Tianweitania populi]